MADDDPAGLYARLRAETARMLGFDNPASLSLVQGLQLDLTALLRLTLDGLQGQALAGQEIDLGRLQSAFGMLQKLLPAAAAPAPVAPDTEGHAVRARFAELIEGYVTANEATEAAALEREEAIMAAEAAGLPPPSPPSPPSRLGS
jgi:hypothetical protein